MKSRKIALAMAALVCTAVWGPAIAQDDAKIWFSWSPKPVPMTEWKAPNKPIWRLNEILDAHKGKADWVQPIVRDQDYAADYISMAPGGKTKPRFWADDRIFWYIASGQVRFHIEGQEPFIAGKGFLVQVPYRNVYWMETVGNEPSLRFEVTPSGETPSYPVSETPTPAKGMKFIKADYTGRGKYDDVNKPYVDFEKDIVAAGGKGGGAVKDDHTWANIIRSQGVPTPPDTSWGHFHENFAEFWLILEGKVDYLIEGQPLFTAEEGDVVYVPQGRWHRASSGGTGMATRLAINPRPEGLHNYQAAQ